MNVVKLGRALPGGRREGATSPLDGIADLVRIRAALAAGLSPVEALGGASDSGLEHVASAARLGQPLSALAQQHGHSDPATQLLLRALAVAEAAGAGASAGVNQALEAIGETRRTERLLSVKTAQARGAATLMAVVPVVAWLMLVALDGRAVRFYATPAGAATGIVAALGMWCGRRWSQRLVARAAAAAVEIDPLHTDSRRFDARRALAAGAPAAIVISFWLGVAGGAVVGVAIGVIAARRRPARMTPGIARPPGSDADAHVRSGEIAPAADLRGGGTPEAAELLALALDSGLAVVAAVGLVADVGPVAAQAPLASAHRRLASGWSPATAFDGTRLESLGELLDAVDRWGAPAAPTLREYAEELRAARRAAAEEAAERTQLALVFPTTLLTLPAFALAIVPPLVWTGFAS